MNRTEFLFEKISSCDDLESFRREILPELEDSKAQWMVKINHIIETRGYTKAKLASLCGVSRTAVAKWCNGAFPSSRDDFVKIGFAAHYSLDRMNHFLQRYGNYPGLYAKSLEDAVYIFVLNSETLPHSFAICQQILDEVRESFDPSSGEGTVSLLNTNVLNDSLNQVKTTEEFRNFVTRCTKAYKSAYENFYRYVEEFINANNYDFVSEKYMHVSDLANYQNWSSSLRQCVSAISQRKWFPLRRKVIVLGLHLNMTVDEINTMLAHAKMEPLCASNIVEGAIIFAVTDADLNDKIASDGGMELCEYVKDVLESLDIPDADLYLNDL